MKKEKKLNQNLNFFLFFFVLTAILKKWRMVAKNRHHFRKEHGPKPLVFQAIHRFLLENNNDENATKFRAF